MLQSVLFQNFSTLFYIPTILSLSFLPNPQFIIPKWEKLYNSCIGLSTAGKLFYCIIVSRSSTLFSSQIILLIFQNDFVLVLLLFPFELTSEMNHNNNNQATNGISLQIKKPKIYSVNNEETDNPSEKPSNLSTFGRVAKSSSENPSDKDASLSVPEPLSFDNFDNNLIPEESINPLNHNTAIVDNPHNLSYLSRPSKTAYHLTETITMDEPTVTTMIVKRLQNQAFSERMRNSSLKDAVKFASNITDSVSDTKEFPSDSIYSPSAGPSSSDSIYPPSAGSSSSDSIYPPSAGSSSSDSIYPPSAGLRRQIGITFHRMQSIICQILRRP